MPVYGNQDILRGLQGTLLQTGNEGENPCSHAFLGTEDAIPSSCGGGAPCNRNYLFYFRSEDDKSWQSAGGMSDRVSAEKY